MATVPGTPQDPDEFYGGIPKALRPSQGDLLIAAGMMHQQGRLAIPSPAPPPQLAFDTSGMRPSQNVEDVRARGPAKPPPALDLLMQDPIRSQRFLPSQLRKPFRRPMPSSDDSNGLG